MPSGALAGTLDGNFPFPFAKDLAPAAWTWKVVCPVPYVGENPTYLQ